MYPGEFQYDRAKSVEHALRLLSEGGESARPLAGGMSLIPLAKLRLASFSHLVDIARLDEIRKVTRTSDGLVIGAAVTHSELGEDEWIQNNIPIISSTAKTIGHVQVRNMGTLGGALAEADPSGDWQTTMMALDAQVVCKSLNRERTVPIDSFYTGPLSTVLESGELIVRVLIPIPNENSYGVHLKLARRTGDYGVAIVSAQIELGENSKFKKVGIGIGAVGLSPFRPKEVERAMVGKDATEGGLISANAELRHMLESMEAISDVKAPAEYRKDVVVTLFNRAVMDAVQRIRGARSEGVRRV